jgi:hypothetical protein
MLLVSCDSHKPSGESFFNSPDGTSERDCEAVWATARVDLIVFCPHGFLALNEILEVPFFEWLGFFPEQADASNSKIL